MEYFLPRFESVRDERPGKDRTQKYIVIGQRKNNMVQIGVTGKNIRLTKAHCQFTGICMKFHTGFIYRKKFFENTAVGMCLTKAVQNLSLLIQDLYWKINTLVKSFKHIVKMMTVNNIV